MLITTQDTFADYEIVETLGLVRGNTVRARHVGNDIMASLRNLVGGEITEYTKLIAESREQAIDRMCQRAREIGADGIVAVRFTTSGIMQAASELFVYGTAVRLRQR
ncbi:MAG: YbjQ family protein [Anaerolineae bacterium]|nr:YbjQ family protein [Anaerolineae bacterium]